MEFPRLIASLTRIVRDIEVAEDLSRDALVAALEQWPESGIPQNACRSRDCAAKASECRRRSTRCRRLGFRTKIEF